MFVDSARERSVFSLRNEQTHYYGRTLREGNEDAMKDGREREENRLEGDLGDESFMKYWGERCTRRGRLAAHLHTSQNSRGFGCPW